MICQAFKDFSLPLFETQGKDALASRALDATNTWHQRARKLGAPLVFWFSVQLMVFREDSVLEDLASCRLDRPGRKRSNQRVVKQKMSNFGVKKPGMKGGYRAFQIRVLPGPKLEPRPAAKEQRRLRRSLPQVMGLGAKASPSWSR